MNIKKIGFRELAMILAIVLLMSITIPALLPKPVTLSDDTVTRISNPEGKTGEADGYIGDREIGYGWSLAERDGYIYIGGWRNTVGSVMEKYIKAPLVESGAMDSDTVWQLIDLFTNAEVPHPTEGVKDGILLKMDRNDPGSFEVIAEMDDPFRNVCAYGDDLYFTTFVGVSGSDTAIWKLDKNDELTQVYSTAQGASMRANCVYEGGMYFAGTMADEPVADGEPIQLAVIKKHDTDDGWDKVADIDDFGYTAVMYDEETGEAYEVEGNYAYDEAAKSPVGSPFWDMTEYDGYIYCTLANTCGFIVYKGHPAAEGEQANKYGWVWTEVAGFDKDSPNNPGFAETKDGYAEYPGLFSVIGALGVFKGQLYAYDIDHTISSGLSSVRGILGLIGGNGVSDEALRPMYETIKHHQSLWRMDSTGEFSEIEGFTELVKGTTNEYIWKHGIYNGELYIGTMDSKVLYNYLTRVTGGSLFEMSYSEFRSQMGFIFSFMRDFLRGEIDKLAIDEFINELRDRMTKDDSTEDEIADDEAFLNGLSKILNEINVEEKDELKALVAELENELNGENGDEAEITEEPAEEKESAYKRLSDKVQEIYQTISIYLKISNYVRKDHQGFDIFKSEDGDNWTVVTDNGFGDKFNYGALRFLTLEEGMYITTANPFYGGQLYLLSNDRGNIVGDVNGDYTVSNADLVMLARYLVHMIELDEHQLANADCDGNGTVNNSDLVMLARYLVHLTKFNDSQFARAD